MNQPDGKKYAATPPNSDGDFYVVANDCLSCMAPESEAPELMGYDWDLGCYFKRQPQTDEEIGHAVRAVRVSCIEALRYGGKDQRIIEKLAAGGCREQVDHWSA